MDYAPKGVQFFYLYKALAHPDLHGYIEPVTIEERLMHIKEAQRTLGSKIPWICDTMASDLKRAIGDAPNSEYLLDPAGKILRKRGWSDPDKLRKDLEEFVGPVEKPTQVSDLKMNVAPPPKHTTSGIVPRLKLPERFVQRLKVEPQLANSKHPFYVKLRVNASGEFMKTHKGKLLFAFRLDPLYGVHWNNLVAPVKYEIQAAKGTTISPDKGQGPKVEAESDVDPREFLVDADWSGSTEPARLTFKYFACTDKMCIPVTQEYLVHRERDQDNSAPASVTTAPARK